MQRGKNLEIALNRWEVLRPFYSIEEFVIEKPTTTKHLIKNVDATTSYKEMLNS